MSFHSLSFLAFLAAVLVLARLLPHRPQNWALLGASYFFYGLWDIRFLGLLMLTTLFDFAIAQRVERTANRTSAKAWTGLSVGIHCLVLGACKFFPSPSFLAPVGISFYTLQSISYVVDVYARRTRAEPRLDDYALFVGFFPQLNAGPIERAEHLLPQIRTPRVMTWALLRTGMALLVLGYFRKCVVADNLAPFVRHVAADAGSLSGSEAAVGLYVLVLFLYADFAGYSDIARGSAALLGFSTVVNFRRPLFATAPPDFWRRWHVSLSTWLRDYVFKPIARLFAGGTRSGKAAVFAGIMTFLIAGLWHGAGWNYLVFGAWHGCLFALFYLWRRNRRVQSVIARLPRLVVKIFGWHLLALPTVVFCVPTLSGAKAYFRTLLFGTYDGRVLGTVITVVTFGLPMLLIDAHAERHRTDLPLAKLPWFIAWGIYLILLALILLSGAMEHRDFFYARF